MPLHAVLLVGIIGLCASVTVSASVCDVSVDPNTDSLHTFADARLPKLMLSSNTDDLTVCLLPGVHSLGGRPLTLTSAHSFPPSSGRRVRWVGLPGAIVSGGVQVTGWTASSMNGTGPNTYQAPLPASLSDTGFPTVRQMWVNGDRANRTVLASVPTLKVTSTGYTSPTPLDWLNPSTVELVYPETVRNWIAPRCTLQSINGTTVVVKPDCWSFLNARAGGKIPQPSVVENARLPLHAGEFTVDMPSKTVYYTAPSATNMSSAQVFMPAQQTLVNGTGVSGHTWTNVTFMHSTWLGPNSASGYVGSQSGVHACAVGTGETDASLAVRSRLTSTTLRGGEVTAGQCEPVGAVHFGRSSDLTFDQCQFSHHGAQYGLSVGNASQHVSVVNCSFTDMSGGAVKLGNVDNGRAVTKDPTQYDMFMDVTETRTSNTANEFWGCATIFAGYVRGTTLSHNTIDLAGYTGISIGWGWGSVVSFAADNMIDHNRITRVMTQLKDGGGIYALGPQPRSMVTQNYVEADENVFGIFYFDNGSRYWNVTFNVAANSPLSWAFFLQGCCNKPALDVHVDQFWWKSCAAPENHCAAENCTDVNVFEVAAGDPWPAPAQAIINAAGVSK